VYPETLDSTFTTISHDWFFNKSVQSELRTHFFNLPSYTSEAFDCENFAVELNQWICRKAALAHVPAAPISLTNCVYNTTPWANIRDGNHALNLILTDRGPFAIEPQSIQRFMVSAPFADYPNKSFKAYA
jgi:hypothetical protein